MPRPHKAQCRSRHYGSETYACATQNPVLGILQATKQTTKHTSQIPDCFLIFFFIFLCWKFRHAKYSQIIQVNRSFFPFSPFFFQYVKQILWFLMLSCRISSCCIAALYRSVFMLYVFCTTYYMYLVMLLITMLFLCCICFVPLCRLLMLLTLCMLLCCVVICLGCASVCQLFCVYCEKMEICKYINVSACCYCFLSFRVVRVRWNITQTHICAHTQTNTQFSSFFFTALLIFLIQKLHRYNEDI